MVWIYLAESEESVSHSETTSDQLLIAKSTPIVKESFSPEWQVTTSTTPPYGMTLQHCREGNLRELLTLSSAASRDHARTLALQEREKDWKESEAGYFSRSCAWPKKSSPHFYFLKMSQPLPVGEDFKSLEKLPRWGMIVGGVLYPLLPLERYTVARDGSYWLTPSTMEHLPVREGEALENAQHRGKNRDSKRKVSGRLNEQVAYPHMWPTPNVSDSLNPNMKDSHDVKKQYLRGVVMNQSNTGEKLCPKWVSVLMGYPIEWLDLDPSVMLWYQSKSKKRSKS